MVVVAVAAVDFCCCCCAAAVPFSAAAVELVSVGDGSGASHVNKWAVSGTIRQATSDAVKNKTADVELTIPDPWSSAGKNAEFGAALLLLGFRTANNNACNILSAVSIVAYRENRQGECPVPILELEPRKMPRRCRKYRCVSEAT